MVKELHPAWDMDLGQFQAGHRIVGAWLKSASAATPMDKELRPTWDMDLGPLRAGHRFVGAWLKSASAATVHVLALDPAGDDGGGRPLREHARR